MKKLLSLLLISVFILSSLAVVSFGEKITKTFGDFEYTIASDDTVTITGYLGSASDVSIPDKIEEKVVTEIGENAFYSCTTMLSVTIPEGVERISDLAFYTCSNLRGINIPSSVKRISYSAFARCSSLESITVEDENEEYSDYDSDIIVSKSGVLIAGCKNSTIPSGVTEIAQNAFDNCSSLSEITIPDTVKTIGKWAFNNCDGLESIFLPDSVTLIDTGAFANCSGLKTVRFPSGLETIEENCFSCCSSLEKLELPKSIKTIKYGAFWKSLTIEEVVIPEGVTFIGVNAFDGCASLSSMSIPASVKNLDPQAIGHNPTLANIYYGGKADELGVEESDTLKIHALGKPFTDVKTTDYFFKSVVFAVENNITLGTSETRFSPSVGCTRAQVVTFLYRTAGEPEYTLKENPFTDVKEGSFYYDAVLWAIENGVTKGTTATTFSPDTICTRGQIVTFIYRFVGEPKVDGKKTDFIDVKNSDYYFDAIVWAVENGVTIGTSSTTFSPADNCTRGQIVTFIYRVFCSDTLKENKIIKNIKKHFIKPIYIIDDPIYPPLVEI